MNQNFVFYQISCPCPIAYCYYSIPGSCLTALPAGGGTLLLSLSLCLLLYLVPVSQRCLLVVVHSSLGVVSHSSLERERERHNTSILGHFNVTFWQCFESGSVFDPYSMAYWIRIRLQITDLALIKYFFK